MLACFCFSLVADLSSPFYYSLVMSKVSRGECLPLRAALGPGRQRRQCRPCRDPRCLCSFTSCRGAEFVFLLSEVLRLLLLYSPPVFLLFRGGVGVKGVFVLSSSLVAV